MKARAGMFKNPWQTCAARSEAECRLHLVAVEDGYLVVVHTRTVAKVSAETEHKLRSWKGPLPELKVDFGGSSL